MNNSNVGDKAKMKNKREDIPLEEDENYKKRAERYSQLVKLSKERLIELFPSRLDKSHLKYESKQTIASDIAESEFPPRRKKIMKKNASEAKKLAIIKSNSAPEVKLKALEKLDSVKNNAQSEISAAIKRQVKMRAEDLKSGCKEMIKQCDSLISLAYGSTTGWDEDDYEQVLKSLNKANNLVNSARDML